MSFYSVTSSLLFCRVERSVIPRIGNIMDQKSLNNPYPDYDGNPGCSQGLFDSDGMVG